MTDQVLKRAQHLSTVITEMERMLKKIENMMLIENPGENKRYVCVNWGSDSVYFNNAILDTWNILLLGYEKLQMELSQVKREFQSL